MMWMLRTTDVETITLKKQAVGPLDVLQQDPEVIAVEGHLFDQFLPAVYETRTAHVLLRRRLIHSAHP